MREVESELMDASIHAIKDGDWSRGFLVWRKRLLGDDNEKSEKSDGKQLLALFFVLKF